MQAIEDEFIAPSYDKPRKSRQKPTSRMELELSYLRTSPWSQQEII